MVSAADQAPSFLQAVDLLCRVIETFPEANDQHRQLLHRKKKLIAAAVLPLST
jgi:hypothetical protein